MVPVEQLLHDMWFSFTVSGSIIFQGKVYGYSAHIIDLRMV